MHEAALAAPLLRLVLEEVAKTGDSSLRVRRVTVRAGLLLPLEPTQLAGIFELMAEGTPAEGAALVVETEPLRGRCPDCGADAAVPTRAFQCPECGSARMDWQGGRELYIASISVERTDAGDAPPPPCIGNQEESKNP